MKFVLLALCLASLNVGAQTLFMGLENPCSDSRDIADFAKQYPNVDQNECSNVCLMAKSSRVKCFVQKYADAYATKDEGNLVVPNLNASGVDKFTEAAKNVGSPADFRRVLKAYSPQACTGAATKISNLNRDLATAKRTFLQLNATMTCPGVGSAVPATGGNTVE